MNNFATNPPANNNSAAGKNPPPSQNPRFKIDYQGILQLIPHRFPFLFVDGIQDYTLGESIVGLKNFTFNEPFFDGHFPGDPVVPGVVQIEALAQVGCLLVVLSFPEADGKRPAFAGIDAAKFKKPVRPGDQLELHVSIDKFKRGFAVMQAKAVLRGEVAAEAVIKATMV